MPCKCETTTADRGAVTAEFALTLPAVILVLVAALAVLGQATTQLRVTDAATAVARAAAVGESQRRLTEVAHQLAGPQAQVSVSTAGGWVTVAVTTPVPHHRLGLGPREASATATAPVEPGVEP